MFHAPDEDESEVVGLMALSPVKRPRDVLKVTYKEWSTSPGWINFWKGGTHLVQRISAMIDSGHLTKAGGKEGGKTRADEAVGKSQGVWRTRKYREQQRLLTHASGACIAQR